MDADATPRTNADDVHRAPITTTAGNSSSTAMAHEDGDEVDLDTCAEFEQMLDEFRCASEDLDPDRVQLDLRNDRVLKTFLNLMLATVQQNGANAKDANTLYNFIMYVGRTLGRVDDFDVKYQVVVALQEYVGRLCSKRTVPVLIELCETLLESEDSLIKEEVLKFVALLIKEFDGDDIKLFGELVDKCYENDWNRCTSIDLMALSYHKVAESVQTEYRERYVNLLNDDSVLVKSAMARNYHKIIQYYHREWLETECIEMLNLMIKDIQVNVRVHAVETSITLAQLVEEDIIDNHLSSIFEKLAVDNSWKVRQEMAARIVDVQKAVKPKMARMLLPTLLQCLGIDREMIVRKSLAHNIIDVVIEFKATTSIDLVEIFEVINLLNKDVNDEVRNKLMDVMMDCTHVLTLEECQMYLLPLMKNTLMCQSIAGVQKVQEQCVYNINKLISVLGYEVMQEEIEAFIFAILSSDSQWRTRRRLVMTLNILALRASEDYFSTVCMSFYKKMLNDPCHAVRRIIPMILPVLIGRFGFEWARKNILSYVFSFFDHPAFSQRLLVLYAMEEIVKPSLSHIPTSKHPRKPYLSMTQTKDYLYKVYSLNEMLKYKLDQLEVALELSKENDIVKSSDLSFYGEDMEDEFADYEVPQEDILELLTFIIKHMIPILITYLNDKVVNVIDRSVHTYRVILELQHHIVEEFTREEFKDILTTFTKDSRQSIESNILLELTAVDGHMDEKFEHAVRGQEFDPIMRFEDALGGSYDDLNTNEVVTFSTEDVLKSFQEFQDRDDCLDSNENVCDWSQPSNESDTIDGTGKTKGDSNGNLGVVEVKESKDEEKNLLADVDMHLFDQKKTVLEFYNDSSSSDAIDI